MKKLFIFSSFLFLIFQMGCLKKDFSPKINSVDDAKYLQQVNTTIAELRSWLPTDAKIYKVPDAANWVIQGIVVSSDRNGSFYKSIHIQDSTAGIQLLIDGSGLYASYPLGMRVFIKLAGLGITTYNNQLELGLFDNTTQKIINIPLGLLPDYILKGSLNHGVDTIKVSDITGLSSLYQSRLVKLSNVMIDTLQAGKQTMGDVISQSSAYSISIQDNRKNSIALVTSPFANFANQVAPKGTGYIVGVLTQYKDAMQFIISGMEDIHFGDSSLSYDTLIPANFKIKNISEVRAYYTGNPNRLPMIGDTAIRGIVVSDNSYKNMPDSQLLVQQKDDQAICIILNQKTNNFNYGDEVIINLNGASLTSQNTGKIVAVFPANYGGSGKDPAIILKSQRNSIEPTLVTLDNLVADLATSNPQYEAQLIKIQNAYFDSRRGQTFKNGNSNTTNMLNQQDNEDQIAFFTKSTYTGTNLVPNGLCNVTGVIIKYFGGYELIMRTPSDIEDLGLPIPPKPIGPFFEDFEKGTKASYTAGSVTCKMGSWYMSNVLIGTTATNGDKFNGKASARMQQNTIDTLAMNFDKPNGVSTITLYHGLYNDAGSANYVLEVSNDQGNTWGYTSSVITVTGNAFTQQTFNVAMEGDIRIRIRTATKTSSGRINIDDIAIADYDPNAVAIPTFSPPTGTTSTSPISVTIASPGATIYYTTDNTDPTISPTATQYISPINISATTIIKAYATKGANNSPIATATYTITLPKVATPTFNPAAGSYTTAQNVEISSATNGATIHYTTDGSTPNESSPIYVAGSPINLPLPSTTTIKAIATMSGMTNSDIATATYTISATPGVGSTAIWNYGTLPTTYPNIISNNGLLNGILSTNAFNSSGGTASHNMAVGGGEYYTITNWLTSNTQTGGQLPYWLLTINDVNTNGNVTLDFYTYSSATGPGTMEILYSVNGGSFISTGHIITCGNAKITHQIENIIIPSGTNNIITFKLVPDNTTAANGKATAITGTSRIYASIGNPITITFN